MQKCISCGVNKPLVEYYKHSGMGNNHLGVCKECCRTRAKNNRSVKLQDPNWVEAERERCRKKALKEYYAGKRPTPENKRRYTSSYRDKYPEKEGAKSSARTVKTNKGEHRHHWSYKKENWNDVIILPAKDHLLIHRYLKYNPVEFYYMTMAGTHLDTRKKHEKFIKSILKAELWKGK